MSFSAGLGRDEMQLVMGELRGGIKGDPKREELITRQMHLVSTGEVPLGSMLVSFHFSNFIFLKVIPLPFSAPALLFLDSLALNLTWS